MSYLLYYIHMQIFLFNLWFGNLGYTKYLIKFTFNMKKIYAMSEVNTKFDIIQFRWLIKAQIRKSKI